MRSKQDVQRVFELAALGLPTLRIARQTGIPYTTVYRWRAKGLTAACEGRIRCDDNGCELVERVDPPTYAYLLGQYLGDGSIVRMRNGTYRLEIATTAAYCTITSECQAAMAAMVPGNKTHFRSGEGVKVVCAYSKHWPCLFPQHGPGRKHTRPIVLEPWQRDIALARHPHDFIRGLIHSDGCRDNNAVLTRGKRYVYPRYSFSNRSDDIRQLFVEACEACGVACRQMNRWTVSIARRADVAVLDDFVGPKE